MFDLDYSYGKDVCIPKIIKKDMCLDKVSNLN